MCFTPFFFLSQLMKMSVSIFNSKSIASSKEKYMRWFGFFFFPIEFWPPHTA
jgi:hypothetical protein